MYDRIRIQFHLGFCHRTKSFQNTSELGRTLHFKPEISKGIRLIKFIFRLLSIGVINGSLPTREVYQYHRWDFMQKYHPRRKEWGSFIKPTTKNTQKKLKKGAPDPSIWRKILSPRRRRATEANLTTKIWNSQSLLLIVLFLPHSKTWAKKYP